MSDEEKVRAVQTLSGAKKEEKRAIFNRRHGIGGTVEIPCHGI